MKNYKDEQPGTLEEGTETHLGVVQGSSLTAYYIDDIWVPFSVIHGTPKMVVPMVEIFG